MYIEPYEPSNRLMRQKNIQNDLPKIAILTLYYVKQPLSGANESVIEGMKWLFLNFTYLLMC